jgi:hypothetical protein
MRPDYTGLIYITLLKFLYIMEAKFQFHISSFVNLINETIKKRKKGRHCKQRRLSLTISLELDYYISTKPLILLSARQPIHLIQEFLSIHKAKFRRACNTLFQSVYRYAE